MAFQILAINPGSTSTKLPGLPTKRKSGGKLRHDPRPWPPFLCGGPFAFRLSTIEQAASSHGSLLDSLSAAAGREACGARSRGNLR